MLGGRKQSTASLMSISARGGQDTGYSNANRRRASVVLATLEIPEEDIGKVESEDLVQRNFIQYPHKQGSVG